jgi:hypothetical protein
MINIIRVTPKSQGPGFYSPLRNYVYKSVLKKYLCGESTLVEWLNAMVNSQQCKVNEPKFAQLTHEDSNSCNMKAGGVGPLKPLKAGTVILKMGLMTNNNP